MVRILGNFVSVAETRTFLFMYTVLYQMLDIQQYLAGADFYFYLLNITFASKQSLLMHDIIALTNTNMEISRHTNTTLHKLRETVVCCEK